MDIKKYITKILKKNIKKIKKDIILFKFEIIENKYKYWLPDSRIKSIQNKIYRRRKKLKELQKELNIIAK